MRIALAQVAPTVGDLDGNRELILHRIAEARDAGADLVVLPELAVTGYPPEDLLLRPGFVRAARASLDQIAAAMKDINGATKQFLAATQQTKQTALNLGEIAAALRASAAAYKV